MVLTMMPIQLIHCLIAPHPPNRVFNHDAPAGKRAIIRDIFGWPLLAARFAARRRPQSVRMQLIDADVGQIANPAHALGQPLQQARLLQHREIGGRSWHPVGHVDDLAGLFVERQLAFQRVLLFLPAVMRIR